MAIVITFFLILAYLSSQHLVYGASPHFTIKTNNGQIFKCVDFYEQPAFRYLSLNLEVMPNITKLQQQQQNVSDFGLGSRVRCPIGSVPILEHPKTVQINDRLVPKPRPQLSNNPQAKEHCSARVQTIFNKNKKFYGAGGTITVYKPAVQSNQWSSSRIKLINGADSIEVGWMVNPQEFKDNEAHFYTSFNAGGKGCINTDCPGFVLTASSVILGIVAPRYSTPEKQFGWNYAIEKRNDGNWWFSTSEEGGKHDIGFWPKSLFTTLKDVANQVQFGGEINDPQAANPPPSMGTGLKAVFDSSKSSVVVQSTVINESHISVSPPDTELFADCPELYTVLDGGEHGESGRVILYGGPGSV